MSSEETKLSGRFSVSKDDPGYKAFITRGAFGVEWRVLLNSHEVKHAVTADTKAGEVVVQVLDENGRPQHLAGVLAQETQYGAVEVFIK